MSKHRKNWSQEDKIKIIQYTTEHGVAKASVEFNVSSSIIYRWQKDLESPNKSSEGEELRALKLVNKLLLRENGSLKEIVAEQFLEIKIKDTIIKKKILREQS